MSMTDDESPRNRAIRELEKEIEELEYQVLDARDNGEEEKAQALEQRIEELQVDVENVSDDEDGEDE
jgi:hypothetical protein